MNKTLHYGVLLLLGMLLMLAGCGKGKEPAEAQTLKPGEIPKVLPDTLQAGRNAKVYVINGIGVSGSNTVAIINNEVVVPGTELDSGVLIKSIHPTYATISIEGKEHLIRPESIQKELSGK